jgi:vitamin K-dependent gamma-carboxylase
MTAIKAFIGIGLKSSPVFVSGASLVFFRMGFGLLMLISLTRFWLKGWIEAYYLTPTFHFTYAGLSWIKPWTAYGLPAWTLSVHCFLLCMCCVAIALGFYYRWACFLFFIGFSYLELIDKTFYLNHYYAISLFALLMCFLPLDQSLSYKIRSPMPLPRWALIVLRLQVGLIYFFAGVAKINGDWLVLAEPLRRWLPALASTPILGFFFTIPATAWLMSWSGMLFDVGIVFFLMSARWRRLAYGAVVIFHLLTALLFPIGLFPWLMMFMALIFFPADWPLRCLNSFFERFLGRPFVTERAKVFVFPQQAKVSVLPFSVSCFLGVFFALQVLMPLRHWAYPGNVLWTEEGFRFAWNVMLIEKTGWVEFHLKDPDSGRQWVDQATELTAFQQRMMSTQPDMILQYAHHLLEKHADTYPGLEVYADSYAALNGRPSQRLIDPHINLRHYGHNVWPKPALQSFIVPLLEPHQP